MSTLTRFFDYLVEYRSDVLMAAVEHMVILVLLPVTLGTLVAVPLGIWAARSSRAGAVILGAVNVIQTIPGLALIALMIPLGLGIGYRPAIVALFLYSLLPIVRNTYTGINGIAPSVREAASAMGIPPKMRLLRVELPLAVPVIMAGIRTSMVLAIGYATLAALVGAGGLGIYITRGLGLVRDHLILVGAIPAAVLAIVMDWALGHAERRFTPKGLRGIRSERAGSNAESRPLAS